jgi:hypothetical protein
VIVIIKTCHNLQAPLCKCDKINELLSRCDMFEYLVKQVRVKRDTSGRGVIGSIHLVMVKDSQQQQNYGEIKCDILTGATLGVIFRQVQHLVQ